VNFVRAEAGLPKQRLSAAVGPLSIEPGRKGERIAGVDPGNCANFRIDACDKLCQSARRKLAGVRVGQA
jgi:hypothetical protein